MRTTFKRWIAAALAVALLGAVPGMSFGQANQGFYFWWQVVDERGDPYTGQNVQCSVYRPNVHAAIVVHTSTAFTTGGNSPLFSDVNGRLHFYTTSSDPVDLTCYYANGGGGFQGRLRRTDHKIILPRQGVQIARFAVNSVSANYQQNSGITIPQGAVIRDVIVQNLAPVSVGTYHLSVGFLGDHAVGVSNALVNAVPLTTLAAAGGSNAEWLRPTIVGPSALSSHRGLVLMYSHVSGTYYFERSYVVHVSSGLTVSFSAQPGTTAAVRAHVYILYERLHSVSNAVPFGLGQ